MLSKLGISRRFMSFTHNLHSPPFFYVNGIRYIQDHDLEDYEPSVQAFLGKRWTTKREVPPKIAIQDDLGDSYRHVYYQQRLAPGDMNYEQKHMERLYNTDDVNTQFIHAMVCQDYEKSMIEEVMQKRVMNGSVVSSLDLPKQKEISKKCDELVDVFYNGEALSDLELDI